MLSQKLIDEVTAHQGPPSFTMMFQEWWFLMLLAAAIAAVVVLLMVQLVKADLAFRQAAKLALQGEGGEEADENAAYHYARRQSFIRPILILTLILFFVIYPVFKYWYGLE